MYRILKSISYKGQIIPINSLHALPALSADKIQILLDRGIISKPVGPPIAAVDGWASRAGKIEAATGIKTIDQLMQADSTEVAEALGYQPSTVDRWKSELISYIDPDGKIDLHGCC